MEERHSFSDPRPAPNGHNDLPSWNVDVYREGVPDPVFTLLVNDETLPPRMRKKKVVWRLPTDQELLPSFGAEDKKRLADLFKVQKKANKRKSKVVKTSSSGQLLAPNPADDAPEQAVAAPKQNKAVDEEKKEQKKATAVKKGEVKPARPAPKPNGNKSGQSKTRQQKPPPPPGIETAPPPPGLRTVPLSTITAGEDSLRGSPPPGFITLDPASLTISPAAAENHSPDGKFFTVLFTSSNIPVELAQTFMDVYYCSMTHGQQEELLLHYVPGAVKSLSLGGAHSFCKSRQEMLIQLNSLQGSLWDVSGVVAQEGFMNSVVLLLTGTCLPKTAPQPIPFCHSITLVKAASGGYQIHNDAMSLLTVGR
jgi:hypothetical protein